MFFYQFYCTCRKSGSLLPPPPSIPAPREFTIFPCSKGEKGEKKPVLATSWLNGFLLSFSRLEHGKIGKSRGAGIDGGVGIKVLTS